MLQILDDVWHKLSNMAAALEVRHAGLADQDDFDIDGVSLTLSKEITAMLDKAAPTLMGFDTWIPLVLHCPALREALTRFLCALLYW